MVPFSLHREISLTLNCQSSTFLYQNKLLEIGKSNIVTRDSEGVEKKREM